MLSVDQNDLRILQGKAEELTALVDRLIAYEMAMADVSLSNLNTNLRQSIPDGGVDSLMKVALNATISGWLDEPCVFQYKAYSDRTPFNDANLTEEINKPFSTKCIESGMRYILVVTRDLSQEMVAHYEDVLKQQVQTISSEAPLPRVISLSALAHWINAVPSVLFEFLGVSGVTRLEQQLNVERDETKVYREYPDWAVHAETIRQHCNFSREPDEQILRVFGLPGVGKTRLVLESLAADTENLQTSLYVLPDRLSVGGRAGGPALYRLGGDATDLFATVEQTRHEVLDRLDPIVISVAEEVAQGGQYARDCIGGGGVDLQRHGRGVHGLEWQVRGHEPGNFIEGSVALERRHPRDSDSQQVGQHEIGLPIVGARGEGGEHGGVQWFQLERLASPTAVVDRLQRFGNRISLAALQSFADLIVV